MKITTVELFKVPPRWLFLRIGTDEGIVGWGEPIVEGSADTVLGCVEELKQYIIGKDPRRIEEIFQILYRCRFYRGGPVFSSAMSGIDQALWDIKGKYYNVPAYELMGGACKDKIMVYYTCGGKDYDTAKASAERSKSFGYKAFKTGWSPMPHGWIGGYDWVEGASAMSAGLRAGLGSDAIIGIDFHGRGHKSMIKPLVKELDQYHYSFYEEPLMPDNIDILKDIARISSTPLAMGERAYLRWGFKDVLEQKIVDIIQPDLSHAGGLWECRKIAAMAETYDVAVAPHCPLGPIAFASCLQLDACTPNSSIQEQGAIGVHDTSENNVALSYLKDREVFGFKDGFVKVPEGPGLGIEINEEYVREQAKIGHNWINPVLPMDDGTPTEW